MFLNGNYAIRKEPQQEPKLPQDDFFKDLAFLEHENLFRQMDVEAKEENISSSVIVEMGKLQQRYSVVVDALDSEVRTRANELLFAFIQGVSKHNIRNDVSCSIDRYTDESIIVRFRQREDLRVTLNFTEPEYIDEKCTIKNVEVAYLSYIEGHRRRILNSSLSVIIDELCRLL